MPQLEIQLLGQPSIRWAGAPVRFATRRALALFAYLAIEGGMQPRAHLAALLWERDEAASRTALRNTLVYLRQAFAGNAPIVADRERIGLDPAVPCVSDLAALRDTTDPERWRHYRGELVAGLALDDAPAFEEWLALQREHWRLHGAALAGQAAHSRRAAGDTAGAREAAQQWLALDPLNEPAAAGLMRAHLAAGEASAALNVFEQTRRLLATEIQAEPSTELLSVAALARQAIPSQQPATLRPPIERAFPGTPFVGRAAELAELATAFHQAAAGRAQAVAVIGESGVGKSRLLAELRLWATAQGADIIEGRAFEIGAGFAYQPVVAALRSRIERERAPDDLLEDVWLSELTRLLPELRERYPDLAPPTGHDSAAQARLYEAVVRLLLALAARAPLLVQIDDLHWADLASCDLIQYLAQRAAESAARILLVVALRSEAADRSAALRDWLLRLGQSLPLRHVQLGLLGEPAIHQLVERLAGRSEGVALVAHWLYSETRGQPFYLAETLVSLYDNGVLARRASDAAQIDLSAATFFLQTHRRAPLPPSLYAVIAARLSRLAPGAFALMAATAVLGRSASFDEICALANADQLDALADYDELVALRIWDAGADDRLGFRHDQIRTVAYAELGAARRRVLHRRAAEHLAERLPPAELAYHAHQAALPDRALRAGLAAGDAALALFAVRDAVAHYEAAHHDLGLGAQPEAPLRVRLYERLGRAYELLQRFDQANAIYSELLAFARGVGNTSAMALALHRQALLAMWQFNLGRAHALLEEALALAGQGDDRLRLAECYWCRAQLGVYTWQSTQALADGEHALELARTLGEQELIARSLLVLAHATANLGRWAATAAYAKAAQPAFADLGDLALQAESLALYAAAQTGQGQPAAGVQLAEAALALGRKIESQWIIIFAGSQLVAALLDRGEIEPAHALAHEGLALADRLGVPALQLLALVGAIRVAMLIAAAQVAALLDRLEQLVSQAIPTRFGHELCAVLGCAHAAQHGRWDEAGTHARTAIELVEQEAFGPDLPRWWLVAALAHSGARELAAAEVARLAALTDAAPRQRLALLRCEAALAATTGAAPRAAELLAQAEQLAAELGLLIEQIEVAQAGADAYRACDAPDQAAATLARARAIAATITDRIADSTLRQAMTPMFAGEH